MFPTLPRSASIADEIERYFEIEAVEVALGDDGDAGDDLRLSFVLCAMQECIKEKAASLPAQSAADTAARIRLRDHLTAYFDRSPSNEQADEILRLQWRIVEDSRASSDDFDREFAVLGNWIP